MQYQNTNLISQSEISHVLEEATNTKLSELTDATISALHSFLLQVGTLATLIADCEVMMKIILPVVSTKNEMESWVVVSRATCARRHWFPFSSYQYRFPDGN